MAQINLVFPILPGQLEAHKAFMTTILGEKRGEHEERCRRVGVNWEQGFYQETPAGTMFLLVVDADAPDQFVAKLMEAPTAYEQWFMGMAGAIHGIDPEKMKGAPAPEFITEWTAEGHAAVGKPTTSFAVPVLDVPAWKAFIATLLGEKRAEFAAERATFGVTRETHWLHQTPMGAFTVIALEGTGLEHFGKKMANPTSAFGTWFLEQVTKNNGFTPEVGNHMVTPTVAMSFERVKATAAR